MQGHDLCDITFTHRRSRKSSAPLFSEYADYLEAYAHNFAVQYSSARYPRDSHMPGPPG